MAKSTLYEILEVSEKASPEVIEKAYKTLVRKNHPDLQPPEKKEYAENTLKKINEAYEILSNEQKRKNYDLELERIRQENEKIKNAQIQDEINKRVSENYKHSSSNSNYYDANNINNNYNENNNQNYKNKKIEKQEAKQRKKAEEQMQGEYENNYNNYLRSLGYKVKERWTKERVKDLFFVILIIIVIITILWLFPPSRNWMINFYESNPILKTIVNIIGAVIIGFFKGIWEFITGLFN